MKQSYEIFCIVVIKSISSCIALFGKVRHCYSMKSRLAEAYLPTWFWCFILKSQVEAMHSYLGISPTEHSSLNGPTGNQHSRSTALHKQEWQSTITRKTNDGSKTLRKGNIFVIAFHIISSCLFRGAPEKYIVQDTLDLWDGSVALVWCCRARG